MRRTIAALAVLAATAPAAQAAGDTADARAKCWTTSARVTAGQHPWTYLHTVSWCGDGTTVTSLTQRAEGTALDGTCTWQGAQETRTPRGDGSWETFSMGDFACRAKEVEVRHVNPWAVVVVHPNGDHEVDSGTVGIEP
ncbi:hypothetical protein ACFFQW_25020 [Umezawaea endophytica]|uniref:Secreted protein n=1 Tax=Umezawaea endophytica TaxID=1654476 RepID=A0A9X3AFZ5_9PSEU|nr:hypothetical protein [Umezawaea endophytica]MCS7479387.1 hypothetical protein [Umezawaea endophytica]